MEQIACLVNAVLSLLFPLRYHTWATCIMVLVFCNPVASYPQTAVLETCTVRTQCLRCTAGDLESIPECKKTGKIETLTCVTTGDGGKSSWYGTRWCLRNCFLCRTDDCFLSLLTDQVDSRHKIESCQRTRTDEEYLMAQLQVICLLVGSFSFLTVKRQRQLYASGFDQRKDLGATASSLYSAREYVPGQTAGNTSFGRASNMNLDRVSTVGERVPLAAEDDSGIEVV